MVTLKAVTGRFLLMNYYTAHLEMILIIHALTDSLLPRVWHDEIEKGKR